MAKKNVAEVPVETTAPVQQNGNGKKKTPCPISRKQFRAEAKPVLVDFGGNKKIVDTKEFATLSLGWFLNDKITLMVGDTPVQVQVGLNLTIVNSKDLPPIEG